jgi:hypothetical protein
MTSGWLAGFVLLVVAGAVMAAIGVGAWMLFLFLSRWDRRGG